MSDPDDPWLRAEQTADTEGGQTTGIRLDAIQFLVRRRYPQAAPPRRAGPPGTREYVARLSTGQPEQMAAAQTYAVELSQMPSTEFQALYDSETIRFAEEGAAKRLAEENSRFFNLPYAAADFDHWSRAAHWTLEEAVALSLGKNPEVVKWTTIERWRSDSPFVVQYGRLLDLARRAVPWQQLFDPVAPGIFIGWVRRNEIAFPHALEDAVRARGNHIVDWKRNYDEMKESYDELSTILDKTRKDDLELVAKLKAQRDEALARLIAGMAKRGYGYDPRTKRSEQVREITSDLESTGVALDADTVRKWLRASAELLPRSQDE